MMNDYSNTSYKKKGATSVSCLDKLMVADVDTRF